MSAGKTEYPLSIILRAVDKASGPLKAANDRIEAAFKPLKTFNKEIGKLWEQSGLKGLAVSIGKVGSEVGSLAMKLGILAGAAGLAARTLIGWAKGLADLGDTAERLGMTTDALAQLRYVGEQSATEMGAMDQALGAFSKNLGQATAGTGRMTAFLKKASPALLKQLKAAKSTEEAFGLMADAMVKRSRQG